MAPIHTVVPSMEIATTATPPRLVVATPPQRCTDQTVLLLLAAPPASALRLPPIATNPMTKLTRVINGKVSNRDLDVIANTAGMITTALVIATVVAVFAPNANAHSNQNQSHADSELFEMEFAGIYMKEMACAVALKTITKAEMDAGIRYTFAKYEIPYEWSGHSDV